MVKQLTNQASKIKTFKGWKTVGFNVAAGIIPIASILGEIINLPEVKNVIPVEYMPIYTVAVVIINLVLRSITTTPVGKKL